MENKLNEAIFNVIHDIGAIKKDTKGYGYMYATLTSVLEALKKPCKDNNIYFIQYESMDNYQLLNNKYVATVNLTTEIYHKDSNEKREYKSSCMVVDATDPQKVGSVITYLRRYALVSIFAMEQEDDDGATATKREVKKDDKKVNNDSSYNVTKDVYEHKVDYNIVPTGENKGKKWIELDNKTLSVAYEYYNKKNIKEYLSIIENILKARKEAEDKQKAIQVSEDDDPFTNAKDDNWDSSFLMNDNDNTQTTENKDYNGDNPFGDDSEIEF